MSHSVSQRVRALTFIEMLTTMAALVILLGLVVSLAQRVRSRSAETLTRQLLAQLEAVMSQHQSPDYATLHAALGEVPPLLMDEKKLSDADLRKRAEENSAQFVRTFTQKTNLAVFRKLPTALYDQTMLRDAWGTPVVYFHPGARNFVIDKRGRAYFMSAGPDRKFSATEDNLYSYEPAWDQ